ncbi:MAG: folylpolyglutamate synthase/dihydrofolate synthase family protein [Bacteroidota bacterium]
MKPTLDFLYSLHIFGMKLGLRNIRALLRSIGNPHRSFKTIHIAGTNGKGSTSSMIAAILTAAGYKVGLYTSPHLVHFNERIRINGEMISDADIVRYTAQLQTQIIKRKATFFEATTAVAFKYFADQNVDIAVIETGLGGRLDSTNVLKPVVSVITSIGKDHTEQLGKTIRAIATEKAGIIKRHVPVVIGKLSGSAKRAIGRLAEEHGSPVVDSTLLSIPAEIELQLKGEHQIGNAKTAIAAVNQVSRHMLIGNAAIRKGLERTTQLTGLRARLEFMFGTPDMLLDVAHNPDGIATLITELKKSEHKKIVVIFGVMRDKDYRSILLQLKKVQPTIIATAPSIERALPSHQLATACKMLGIPTVEAATVREALKKGNAITGKNGLLVITGSHYLVGEAIPLLEKKS